MKFIKTNKRAISLIVLVITIIVMIILAGTIILSLSSMGVIGKAQEATQNTNLNNVQHLATMGWSNAYTKVTTEDKDDEYYQSEVINYLKTNGISDNELQKYSIVANKQGVEVKLKTAPAYIDKTYMNQDGEIRSMVTFYANGSILIAQYEGETLIYSEKSEENMVTYDGLNIIHNASGEIMAVVSSDAKSLTLEGATFQLMSNEIIPNGATYYVGVKGDEVGNYASATAAYTEGNEFPTVSTLGDVYVYGDYEYRLMGNETISGWWVRVLDKTKSTYGEILNSVNGQNVMFLHKAFNGCTALTSAPSIPSTIGNMEQAFKGCTSLTDISKLIIPSGVTNMYNTFEDCIALEDVSNIIIPSGVKVLSETFANCRSLKNDGLPTIPNSVTSLDSTFRHCVSLTDVSKFIIPNRVQSVSALFYGCTSLTNINGLVIPDSVLSMDYMFLDCTSLTDVSKFVIPKGVLNMASTFSRCTSLSGTVTINANPDYYTNCLEGTQITEILGDTTMKTEIFATK